MNIYEQIISAPHTLIAGTTGSGKSTLMNGIIKEFMNTNAYMILLDPKSVELSLYKDCDKTIGYADKVDDIVYTLECIAETMEERYSDMKDKRIRFTDEEEIYVFIDELADLMISARKKEFLNTLQRILQKGRAAGIHVIAATQTPARKIIPAELVVNFTDRVALRCVSPIESRQIIDKTGAEKLPKHGKAIYRNGDGYREMTIPYISTEEAETVAMDNTTPTRTKEYPKGKGAGWLAAMLIISCAMVFVSPLAGWITFIMLSLLLVKLDLVSIKSDTRYYDMLK